MAPDALDVRTVEGRDEGDVVALWQETFPGNHTTDDLVRDFRQKLRHQGELFLIAVWNGQAVATALGGYDGHRGHVHAVAVAPAFRRHGVGRRLFEELILRLRACGCSKLNLLVRPDNSTAIAFYNRLGFQLDAEVSMSRRLNG